MSSAESADVAAEEFERSATAAAAAAAAPEGAPADAAPAVAAGPDDDWAVQRDACKLAGDAAFRAGDDAAAVRHYSAALSLDPDLCVAYSNRSAAYLRSGQKSRALRDAEACVALGGMGAKGRSRLAAALQALGRWGPARESWNEVLRADPGNAAAVRGVKVCDEELRKQEAAREEEETSAKQEIGGSDDAAAVGDDLDDFFNDVEEAAAQVQKEKELAAQPQATDAIKNQKKRLGTAQEQIDRLLKENYKWRNLNPFYVLDVPHTATSEEISRRFKGLSLLLHPDKNTTDPRAQEAYDEVLKAKAALDDENKASHCRQLVEKGMIRGESDWKSRTASEADTTLEEYQSKATQRIFADIEQKRREVERRERQYEQRTQQQEDDEERKEIEERKFNKEWKQEERVEKRIGGWRDFAKKARLV